MSGTLLKSSSLCSYLVRIPPTNIRFMSDLSGKSSMASPSTSSIRKNFKYHVFLSFRGADTRTTFVDHLYVSLKRLGIHTFRDNEELEKGKRIGELFKAIEESKFFIIVFSKNYASSSWCLKELAKIMDCQDTIERIAYPLFHDVEPTDIRNQSGAVGRAIAKHKTDKHITIWKKALEDAGNLVGWDLKKIANGHEAEAIDQIVKEISVKLRSIYLSRDENLIGMESRMQDLESSLGIGLDDEVCMIGIKGMGGIGKTTLARAIFNKVASQFEGISFVDDVSGTSKAHGLLSLQQNILRDVLKDDSMKSVQDAISMMKIRMPLKKVLLVLDDVNHKDQLEALAGDWFKGGSRIIITTRNTQVLKSHRVNRIHDISFLSNEEAVSLLSRYAFERYIPIQGYEDLSFKFVKYAAGLPLTLKVLGSFLLGKEKVEWMDTLKRLETIPEKETIDKLKISYDGLEDDQKEIFLDVACFMKWMLKEDAIRRLESRGFHAIIGLRVLEERSLITISKGRFEQVNMHDSIQELGRNIVRRLHPREPNKHSRLWIPNEIKALLSDDEVTEVTATYISVGWLDSSPEIIMKGLEKLKKLRVLCLSAGYGLRSYDQKMFDFDQYHFPNSLQFLKWGSYPRRSLPQTLRANNLIGLELPESNIIQLWESGEQKVLSNLRFLDLRNSKLVSLDLGMTPNLERLHLQGCVHLTRLDVPAGCLKRLVYLNLIDCSRIISFSLIQQLESLEHLSLAKLEVIVKSFTDTYDNLPKLSFACFYLEDQTSSLENSQKVSLSLQPNTRLEGVSASFFGLQHLRHLKFDGCIRELPNDFDRLSNLEELNLVSTDIRSLPDSICMLKHLKSLQLKPCLLLEELPRDLGQLVCLEKLSLWSEQIKRLPDSICMMKNLKSLELIYCIRLEELPRDVGQLVCLEKLTLWSEQIKHLPDSICKMKNMKALTLQSCLPLEKLPEDLGQLESLEKLILIECSSLKNVPNSICNMKRLQHFYLPFCNQVSKLPEEVGSLECLKELDITLTRISHLPQSISSLKNLRIVGAEAVLRSCAFATEIQTSEGKTFCYIQEVDNTEETGDQSTESHCNRWRWSVVVLVVGLLVRRVMQSRV